MKIQRAQNETGQILVIIVGGLVALMAFVALAIDGGMLFYDRRSAQNAADAAALAGAYELARYPWDSVATLSNKIETAAKERAADNFYVTGVTVIYPHPDPDEIRFVEGDTEIKHYVRVEITSTVNTSFIHLVYKGPVQNTVSAVAHVIPPEAGPSFRGAGLVSLKPHNCNGLYISGNLNANLIGGGIFVNSDDPNCAVDGPGESFQLYSPSATVVGKISDKVGLGTNLLVVPGPAKSPAPSEAIPYPPMLALQPPVCPSAASQVEESPFTESVAGEGEYNNYEVRISPAADGYGSISSLPNKNIWFEPGIYCITADFSFNSKQVVGGEGVLFYLTGAYQNNKTPCNFTWNGGATMRFKGYGGGTYKGLLIYVDPGGFDPAYFGSGPMQFNGTGESFIIGTIYGPTCSADLNGTGGNMYRGQLAAYDIKLSGTATINMLYVTDDNYEEQKPSKVDLNQ